MALTDINGRAYARKSTLEPKMLVEVDEGFTCMKPHSRRPVHKTNDGRLWVSCSEGRHYLDGQLDYRDETDAYIGIYPVT